MCHLCIYSLGSPCLPQLMTLVHARRALALQKEALVSFGVLDILGLHAENSPQRSMGTQTSGLWPLQALSLCLIVLVHCCCHLSRGSREQLSICHSSYSRMSLSSCGVRGLQPGLPYCLTQSDLQGGMADRKSNCTGDLLPCKEI